MAEPKTLKNPLNQAFGMVLRKERERRSWSYQDIEKKSSLKASYIQQVEKGQFNLHVSNCFVLYQTFKHDVPKGGYFTLEGIMQLLCVISVLEAQGMEASKIKDRTYLNAIKKAAKEISKSDAKLDRLFEKFFIYKVFDAKTSDEAAKIISNTDIDKIVEDFLINNQSFGKSETEIQESYPLTFFKDIPTDKVEFLEKIKEVVKTLPYQYDYRMSWNWEETNKQKFRNAFILDKNPELLTGYQNLSSYQYDYLWEENFLTLKLILVSEKSPEYWLSEFKKNLKKSLNDAKKQKHLSLYDTAIKKVAIKCVSLQQDITIADSITNPDDKIKYNATWAFSLSNNFQVGVRAFINNSDARLSIGDYLNFEETIKMVKAFSTLWDSI